jgi:hypothetical protein
MNMKVTYEMTQDEKLKIMHSALCNGLYYFSAYGINLDWNSDEYKAAKESLEAQQAAGTYKPDFTDTICVEDIWAEMLRTGKSLTITDLEESDDEDEDDFGPVIGTISLETIEANWDKIPAKHMQDMVAENDDANTADIILQCIAFGEERYG